MPNPHRHLPTPNPWNAKDRLHLRTGGHVRGGNVALCPAVAHFPGIGFERIKIQKRPAFLCREQGSVGNRRQMMAHQFARGVFVPLGEGINDLAVFLNPLNH